MNFTVTWLPPAEAELTAIWMASADRNAITRAAAEIDRLLAANAAEEGESRPNYMRITFARPLAVLYRVNEQSRSVAVGRVWEFK